MNLKTKKKFLNKLGFPRGWIELYTDELANKQIEIYDPEIDDGAPEHIRYGAFWWWFRSTPSVTELEKLYKLAGEDPDHHMGESAKKDILEIVEKNSSLYSDFKVDE